MVLRQPPPRPSALMPHLSALMPHLAAQLHLIGRTWMYRKLLQKRTGGCGMRANTGRTVRTAGRPRGTVQNVPSHHTLPHRRRTQCVSAGLSTLAAVTTTSHQIYQWLISRSWQSFYRRTWNGSNCVNSIVTAGKLSHSQANCLWWSGQSFLHLVSSMVSFED